MSQKEYYTTTEAAAELGYSPSTVYRWAMRKAIKASRPVPGGEFRIPRAEVLRLKGESVEVSDA